MTESVLDNHFGFYELFILWEEGLENKASTPYAAWNKSISLYARHDQIHQCNITPTTATRFLNRKGCLLTAQLF
jgi:hypothetical protein